MKYLIIGLGNIGAEYAHTRHNIGFDVVDKIAKNNKAEFTIEKLGDVCKFRSRGRTIVLIKPNTYMNLSGKAVNYWLQKEKINLDNTLIITDDLALPLGKTRLKAKGSDGGHNGLKSIIEVLNTTKFPRMRIGIGKDFKPGEQVNFVLGKWTDEEKPVIENMIIKSTNAVSTFCFRNIGEAMNLYNQ